MQPAHRAPPGDKKKTFLGQPIYSKPLKPKALCFPQGRILASVSEATAHK